MAYISEESSCCGVNEICNLATASSAERVIREVCGHIFNWDKVTPFYYFTDIDSLKYATKLVKYIKTHKLGTIISTTKKINPHSGNHVKMYIWSVNSRNLKAWNYTVGK